MTRTDIKKLIKQTVMPNWIFYLTGLAIVLSLKLFYKNATAEALTWILTPTSCLVSLFSGVPFTWEPHMGYVNHDLRFIIAPSCSGVSFLTIAIAMLIFSFVHRMESKKKSCHFIVISLILSYCYTVVINCLRIILSIYLPFYFEKQKLFDAWLTPQRLHTMIGTTVYFSALLILYPPADALSKKLALMGQHISLTHAKSTSHGFLNRLIPLFWYLTLVLGIPFIGRVLRNDFSQFREYTGIILIVCLTVCTLSLLLYFSFHKLRIITKYLTSHRKSLTTHQLHSMSDSRNTLSFIKAGFAEQCSGGNK